MPEKRETILPEVEERRLALGELLDELSKQKIELQSKIDRLEDELETTEAELQAVLVDEDQTRQGLEELDQR